jgi:fido (protein-threonine AMPylation protein)
VSFNPDRLTDNADRAAAWILKASSSRNEVDNIRTLLREFSGNGKSLTDPAVYKELHRRLVPQATDALRSPTAQARYPSNVSGAAMLEQHLAALDSAHEHFGKQMLGAFLGYHSFVDGNGRTARAIYAITELRANRFNALPLPVENALSGLG